VSAARKKAPAKPIRLSDVQRAALGAVNDAGGTATLALFSSATAKSLERAGYVIGRQSSSHTPRRYVITHAGAVALARSTKAVDRAVRNG
jgi:hypothetical protein